MHASSRTDRSARSAKDFHYAQEVFEGTKVYRLSDGNVGSSRLRDNARRMNRSADRTCMPELDEDFQIEAITRLVDLDRDWVPSSTEHLSSDRR